MATLFVDGKVAEDTWVSVEGGQPVPEDEDVLVSLAVFEEYIHVLLSRSSGRLGVHLEAGEQVEAIANHLDALDLVSLDFPSFADGRAFSKARLLRDRYGFEGEVRGVGDIRIDQVGFMKRSGCNALMIVHQQSIDAVQEGRDPALQLFYQRALSDVSSISGKRWARRAV